MALVSPGLQADDEGATAELAGALQDVGQVYPSERRDDLRGMLRANLRRRLQAANDLSRDNWRTIDSAQRWQQLADDRREALAEILGRDTLQKPPLRSHVTGSTSGDGFTVDNVVFNSRPGVWITANVYRPRRDSQRDSADRARESTPGIVICHSHHTPKTHGELQDMGMTWARMGCVVIVPDALGHGERRTHPFARAEDYDREFRVSRQDYYFRYDNGIQLLLAGESLVGQIAWDLSRCADYLLARAGVDPQRLILLGAVAGGGDPAAVAAMLDQRFAAAAPFNFGGPQPETRYPLPDDAELSFNYAGSGSWESTRNIAYSAARDCLPWVIVGGIAPRRLIFSHEFNWDRPRDPVWKRLQKIYQLHDASDHLAFTVGSGEVTGSGPENTHCTHIGRHHRKRIHEALQRWFDIQDGAEREYSQRLDSSRLLCMTEPLRRKLDIQPLRVVAMQAARRRAAGRTEPSEHRWQYLYGSLPRKAPEVAYRGDSLRLPGGAEARKTALSVEEDVVLPLVLLTPAPAKASGPRPVVVLVGQAGKSRLLAARRDAVAELLHSGVAVCLPDLRGTGETRPDDGRARRSSATSLSSTELMLGGTMVGARLRDLHSVILHLRDREDVDGRRIAVWGESLAAPNDPQTEIAVPRGIDGRAGQSEPLGGLLALLAAATDSKIRGVVVSGGLTSFASVMDSPFVQIPHDVVLPRILEAGDLPQLAAAASTPVRVQSMIDGLNRPVSPERVREIYRIAEPRLTVADEDAEPAAKWLADLLLRD